MAVVTVPPSTMRLRYGTNPHQRAEVRFAGAVPFKVLAGDPSYVNLLDALNAWALVRELSQATGAVAATSFKHVSPAGAAVAGPLDPTMQACWAVPAESDDVTRAYVRARDADPKSSFGDFIAVSAPVTCELAAFLRTVVSDGIIAPSYEPGAVALLASKKGSTFLVLEMDLADTQAATESRTVFGVSLHQDADTRPVDPTTWNVVQGPALTTGEQRDAAVAMITLRHTQSNSVLFATAGMCLGIGAGQQSRIDCTLLAGNKTAIWWLRRHPLFSSTSPVHDKTKLARQLAAIETLMSPRWMGKEPAVSIDVRAWLATLSGVTAASDGYLPFADNIEAMAEYGVRTVMEPGGSLRSAEIGAACRARGITLVHTGHRLFHH